MDPLQAKQTAPRSELAANALPLALGCCLALVLSEVALRGYVMHRTKGVSDSAELSRSAARTPPAFTGRCGGEARDAKFGEIVRPSDDPDLIFELKPGIDTCFKETRVQTNRTGHRAPREYARPKPEGTYRVLLLGDSQTFGHGVEYEATFGQRIELALQEQFPSVRVEVINSGVGGYNLYQEAAYLEHEGLSFEPDAILILFIGNDLELPIFLLSAPGPLAIDRLYLGELLAGSRDSPGNWWPPPIPTGLYVPPGYQHMAGIDGYRTALQRIGAATRERGIAVLNFVDDEAALQCFGNPATRAAIREFGASVGILEPPFVYPRGLALSEDDAHLNPEGHQRLAEQMLDALRANGIAPPLAAVAERDAFRARIGGAPKESAGLPPTSLWRGREALH